jgi:hypothetical protein
MKNQINEYKKNEKQDFVGTSILIEPKQLKYLKDQNLNLSKLVRHWLESLINSDTKNKATKK